MQARRQSAARLAEEAFSAPAAAYGYERPLPFIFGSSEYLQVSLSELASLAVLTPAGLAVQRSQ